MMWMHRRVLCTLFMHIPILITAEWIQREKQHALQLYFKNRYIRWIIYILLIFTLGMYTNREEIPFIYFQF
jgi:hypothetical protein